MYYNDIYRKRLNKFGSTYQTRIQGEREHQFEYYLKKTIYRVTFLLEEEEQVGSLEPYKQDSTETLHYLLTRRKLIIPNGTILEITNEETKEEERWMVYWLENMRTSGYNRYVVLKMTHKIMWKNKEGTIVKSWAYFHGKGTAAITDTIKSNSANVIYLEDSNSNFLILPLNENLQKQSYFEITIKNIKQGYRVTGYDIISTPGVEYVTVDPIYIMDKSPLPEINEEDKNEDIYWLEEGE